MNVNLLRMTTSKPFYYQKDPRVFTATKHGRYSDRMLGFVIEHDFFPTRSKFRRSSWRWGGQRYRRSHRCAGCESRRSRGTWSSSSSDRRHPRTDVKILIRKNSGNELAEPFPKKMSTEMLRRTTEQITGLDNIAWLQYFFKWGMGFGYMGKMTKVIIAQWLRASHYRNLAT